MNDRASEYCLTAWNNLKANAYRWHSELNTNAERTISRMFYQAVFDSLPDRTGLSSYPGAKYTWDSMVDDHYMAPQTVAKFVMDHPKILNSYDLFKEIFQFCRKTNVVTKEENNKLAQITKKQPVLTKDKYHYLGIKLYHGYEELPTMNQVLDVPKLFDEWEQKFIKNDFRPTTVYVSKKPNLDEFFI